jgi:hypothetical protein
MPPTRRGRGADVDPRRRNPHGFHIRTEMKRRVLIVTASYQPAMAADMHRARQLAWELEGIGWSAEILSPDAGYQPQAWIEPDSDGFFSGLARVHYVRQQFAGMFQRARISNIGIRAFVPLAVAGRKLLRQERFDLVYISTAQFPLFLLGPLWRLVAGAAYVLDLHDPVYREGEAFPMWSRPSWRHRLARRLAGFIESRSVRGACGLISVSPAYVDILAKRYGAASPPWMRPGRSAVIPFGVMPRDFEVASASMRGMVPSPATGQVFRLAYVGAGGPIMVRSFERICQAIAAIETSDPDLVKGMRIELYGTMAGWVEGGRCHLAEVAARFEIGHLVQEKPGRISYRRSVELLAEADGVLVLGVDDAGYMPSKLFSYALSGKPLLASFREGGAASRVMSGHPGLGHLIEFPAAGHPGQADAQKEVKAFLLEAHARTLFNRNEVLKPYLADSMAARHLAVFEACLAEKRCA